MKDVTKLVTGRHGHKMERLDVRTVNPSINRGSTYLYDNMNHMSQVRAKARELGTQSYGINGGDITVDWQEAFCELENGFRGVAVSSGLLACTAPLLALLGEAKGRTGYSHQADNANADFRPDLTMVSVETEMQAWQHWAKGHRTFRMLAEHEQPVAGQEILCPSPKVKCTDCGLCTGMRPGGRRARARH